MTQPTRARADQGHRNSVADIRLITFDLDETLWPLQPTLSKAEQASSEYLVKRVPAYEAFLTSGGIREIREQVFAETPSLRLHVSRFRLRVLTRALIASGLPEENAKALAQGAFDVFLEIRQRVTLFPGMEDVLERLSARFTLGALTNGNASIERVGIKHLFAFFFSAETVERGKPHPDMFLAALESARVRPAEAIHIGDSLPLDIAPAEALGMHTIWANFGCQDRPLDQAVKYEARQVADLEPCIEKIVRRR